MYFVLQRTKKTLKELQRQITAFPMEINFFKMKDGNFLRLQDVDRDESQWTEYISSDMWGGRDVHAWFRTIFKISDELDGRTVVLKVKTDQRRWGISNPQFILYVNGE